MNYLQIPGDPRAVVWRDGAGSSGVIRQGDEGWDAYLAWLSADNELEPLAAVSVRTMEELRASAIAAINASADVALEPITRQYPRGEIDSWPEQCLEARAWLADSSADTPLLDAIVGDVSDEEMKVFCLIVLSKADEYKATVGAVIAWRRVCTQWVESQTDKTRLINFEPQYSEVPNAS